MEKRKFKKHEIVLSIIVIFIIFIFAFSYIMYRRSVMATLSEYFLSLSIDEMTEAEVIAELESRKNQGETKYVVEYDNFNFVFEEKEESGMQVFYLNEQEKPKDVIIYLHGGTYVDRPVYFHWRFLNKLANNTKAEIVVPMYPLAPHYTYDEAYNLLTSFYRDYTANHPDSNVILMGDSAGGGLALGLAEHFGKQNINQPDRLILISPWVDISMTNEKITDFISSDPMLQLTKLNVCAKSWAGDKDLKYWKVSPIYGDLSKLNNVTIFVGTREILYPDCKLLAEKLESANVEHTLVVATGCNHDYLLYPIREANQGITVIKKSINSIDDEKKDEENNK